MVKREKDDDDDVHASLTIQNPTIEDIKPDNVYGLLIQDPVWIEISIPGKGGLVTHETRYGLPPSELVKNKSIGFFVDGKRYRYERVEEFTD